MSCRWLSIKQFADLAGVHHTTVRRWISQGKLPHARIGKVVRICEMTLEKLESQEPRQRLPEE